MKSSKKDKIFYYTSTSLLSAIMLFSAGNYFFNHQMVVEAYTALGFPTFLIYYSGTAKILGLGAIWSKYSRTLTEWAYAGFTYVLLLAILAHVQAGDGQWIGAGLGLLFLTGSYYSYKRISK